MSKSTKKPPAGGRLPVQIPGNLTATYANFALVTNSRSEIVIDFAQIMPQTPQARVQARIVMTPFNTKLLLRALKEHMERFETQYGEIDIPESTSLADQLFKPPTPDPEKET
jgi:hypothetical protein